MVIEQVPEKLRSEDSISSLDQLAELEGLVTETDLYRREELVVSRLVAPDPLGRGRINVPDGLLEVSVALDGQRTVGGTLIPGDLVAVLASFSFNDYNPGRTAEFPFLTDEELRSLILFDEEGAIIRLPGGSVASTTEIVLQKVLVTNVQLEERPRATDETESAPSVAVVPTGNLIVTLALLPDEVEALVHSQTYGSLWLARQQADDVTAVTADLLDRPQPIAQVMK